MKTLKKFYSTSGIVDTTAWIFMCSLIAFFLAWFGTGICTFFSIPPIGSWVVIPASVGVITVILFLTFPYVAKYGIKFYFNKIKLFVTNIVNVLFLIVKFIVAFMTYLLSSFLYWICMRRRVDV